MFAWTFCLYQGEELALTEAELKFEHLVDPWGIATWPEWQGRDGCRTPMPWNEFKHNAGFTEKEGMSWLPVCRKHYPMAVRQQELDKESMLNFTRDFLKWRKNHPIIQLGDIDFIDHGSDVLAFTRSFEGQDVLCVFNLVEAEKTLPAQGKEKILYSVGASMEGASDSVSLSSFGFAIIA